MIVVTGAAGFIGFHVVQALAAQGRDVVGVDSLNSYYDPALKAARLAVLSSLPRFRFVEGEIETPGVLEAAAPRDTVEGVIHLAAQAGVRYSLDNPFAYERSNLAGHLSVLEYARHAPRLRHLVYASSSSVYGDRTDGPFREDDRCDAPASLYAATKRAGELMSETYARLYALPQTGLRFFTVYGPWGRPDMAYWSFTDRILRGDPITLFGEGRLSRDFTFVDDIVRVIPTILETPPTGAPPHRVVNLGNSRPTDLRAFVAAIEAAAGSPAKIVLAPAQPGDVTMTFADVSRAQALYGFAPDTRIEDGIAHFVDWRRAHPHF
jgi:UDP-glucuronate 4-epimerase